jgi:hypothetical protein
MIYAINPIVQTNIFHCLATVWLMSGSTVVHSFPTLPVPRPRADFQKYYPNECERTT